MDRTFNYSHQHRLFDPRHARHVTLLGIGSVGSEAAVSLVKMGCRDLEAWDDDVIESHNPSCSAYRPEDLGLPKTLALARRLGWEFGLDVDEDEEDDPLAAYVAALDAVGMRYRPHTAAYAGERLPSGVVMTCVDKMEARMAAWERAIDNPNVTVFVDTRVVDEFIHVLAIDPCHEGDQQRYRSFLYPTKETRNQVCGQHGVSFIAGTIANLAVNCVAQAWSGRGISREFRMLVGSMHVVYQRDTPYGEEDPRKPSFEEPDDEEEDDAIDVDPSP